MLAQLIAFMDAEEWDLDSIQIAEILWFVQQVSLLVPETDERGRGEKTPESEDLREGSGKQAVIFALSLLIQSGLYQLALLLLQGKREANKKAFKYPLTIPPSSQSASSTSIEQTSFPTEKLPIKLPDTGIFRNTLELGRLTKPLKQKINSRIARELNVKETVRQSAELSTPKFPRYFPILKPKKERWLDVALLIEDSQSMILWQSLLKEVQDFLEHLGAFRDIKPYRMNWDDDKKNLQISSFHCLSNYLPPQGLNDPGGRRLILIVSDCISSAWTSDKFIEILKQWSTKGQLTLLNPFPERMWERTNLDYSIKIRLGNKKKGLPTQKWLPIPLESWQVKGVNEQTKQTLVKLPILSLEPESMGAWVNVMMGKGTSLCSGVWLGSKFLYPKDEEEDEDEENLEPSQQINNFYATSSQLAWELIQWLSAIPVSLSTIRLVQRTLLPPESTQVNVAEVVMGGLLSPVKPLNSYQSPHQIQFEFKPGIREAFLERLGEGEFCLGVIGSLTEKIASHFGYQTVREFEAILLTNPLEFRGDEDLELIQAFATISVSTLRQYGGEYAPYIRKLDRSRARLNLLSAVEGDSVSLNWIDFLEGIAQQHYLTEIETETLINLLPTPQKTCSIPEVAKHLHISQSDISNRLTNICRKFETLKPDLFQSKRHNKLKTLQLYLYSQYLKSTSPQFPELDTFEAFEFEAEVATIVFKEETIDYTHLENLLAAQQWKEADLETANIMLKATNQEQRGWLEAVDLQQLPSDILQILDRLWFESSGGHFGFSVQKQIWLSVGGQPGQEDDEIYKQFGNRVGWYIRNRDYWLLWDEHTFSREAPPGHLPRYLPSQEQRIRPSLLSRPDLPSRTETTLSSRSEKKKELNTILLVEDESAIVEEVSELLSSHYGITVRGTEDVNEVIDLAQSGDIDLILINDHLPNSRYQGKGVNGIDIVRLLRDELNISRYLPIIGFSSHKSREKEFLKYADGFYDKNKGWNEGAEQDFINYLRKIFNRVKLIELLPYESAEDLDLVLDLISKRDLEGRDTSEEDVSSLWNKPKGDDSTFYLLENLRLLNVVIMNTSGQGPGTVRYDPSPSYLNQNSPRLDPPPDGDEFEVRLLQLYSGQRDLLDLIKQRNEQQQDTSLADAAPLFSTHPEGGNIATYRRLENLRLLSFLSITERGTSRETIRYNLSLKYSEYLGFETVTVNSRGEIIKTTTHTASYFTESLTDNVDLEMVAIPGGTFTMGSPENEGSNLEYPQHNVTISPFFMGKYPVTQAQWKAIASQDGLKIEIDLDPDPSEFKGDNRPVETVNWYEAVEFCKRLSKLTGRDYRLPSEAEWEYACRGVTEPLDLEKGESYPPFYFGETITSDLANYDASSTYADEPKGKDRGETTTVGQFSPNVFGLYDLHGQVWEWCADDWHDNYEGAPTDGSAWIDDRDGENINHENESYSDKNNENESYTVMRGGSWNDRPEYCRSASRLVTYRRVDRNDDYGFRVVCGFGRTL